jgi:hypothetical protein
MKTDYVVVLLLALSLTASALFAYFLLSEDDASQAALVTRSAPGA